jgi:hypothetical protein
VVQQVAAEHGRTIDPEHFGALIAYRTGPLPDLIAEFVRRRRPGIDAGEVIPERAQVVDAIKRMIDVGASKFVLIPVTEPEDWRDELRYVADVALPLET